MTEDQDTGLSAPILSTPIVSPPASALRSTPIPGDIADEDTDEMVEFESAKQTTITITISREDAEAMRYLRVNGDRKSLNAISRMQFACFTALKGER